MSRLNDPAHLSDVCKSWAMFAFLRGHLTWHGACMPEQLPGNLLTIPIGRRVTDLLGLRAATATEAQWRAAVGLTTYVATDHDRRLRQILAYIMVRASTHVYQPSRLQSLGQLPSKCSCCAMSSSHASRGPTAQHMQLLCHAKRLCSNGAMPCGYATLVPVHCA